MANRRKRPRNWRPEALARLTDDELIALCATVFADRTILKEGNLVIENRIKHGAPPESIEMVLQEAQRRGIPLAVLAQRVVDEGRAGQSFISTFLAPPSWRRYEMKAARAIRGLLESQGIRLDRYEFDARVVGRITGQERQVDLLLVRDQPRHVVACEFREYPERLIVVEKVEAFASKLKDVDANRGALVTPSGYHKGAVATAKHHQIDLFRLHTMPAAEIRATFPDHAARVMDTSTYWVLEDQDGRSWVFEETLAA